MIVRGHEFSDIYDLVGVRVLVDSVRDCYAALGTIHALWNPVPGRFKDFIAMPKFNMYQSLHTTVIGPAGKTGRDPDPHARACTARPSTASPRTGSTRSPRGSTSPKPQGNADDMAWLRQLLDWQRETEDPGEFLDSLRFDLYAGEVFVFTPKGDVVALPDRRDPGRLRLRGAHRGRPPMHRRPRQRPAGAAREPARERRRRSRSSRRRRRRPRRARTGCSSSGRRGRATRSGSGSPRSAARTRSRRARRRSAGRCASRACRCSGCSPATR